jgi:hypothetical protein
MITDARGHCVQNYATRHLYNVTYYLCIVSPNTQVKLMYNIITLLSRDRFVIIV